MKINNIKRSVYEGLINYQFDSNIDKIIASCLLYDYCYNICKENSSAENNLSDIVKSFATIYKGIVNSLKTTFVSYTLMRKKIEEYGKETFIELAEDQILEITQLYQNKAKIVKFSTNSFSQYMYKVANLKYHQFKKLARIHKEVMSPIIRYYIENHNLIESDLEIYDAEVYSDNPGRSILFAIRDVSSARVINDIKRKVIHIDYLDLSMQGSYIKITTK